MNEKGYRYVQDAIDNGYTFRTGEYVEQGIDLFRKNVAGFAGYTAVVILGVVVLAIIPILGQLALLVVAMPLSVGYHLVAHRLHRGESVEFRDFFKGFDHLGQLLLLFLVMMFAFGLLMAPLFSAMAYEMMSYGGPNLPEFPRINWYLWLLVIPMVYLGVSWRWASLFVVFFGMTFWEALEASRQLIHRQWFRILFFSILVGLFGNLGYLIVLVGLLFSLPMAMCVDYAAFADITRLTEAGQLQDDIAEHLVD